MLSYKEYLLEKFNTNPIVYHGTYNNFDDFEDNTENGIWFIDDKEEALEYGNKIITAKLKMRNPYVSSHEENVKLGMKKLVNKAKQKGHDSIILPKDTKFYETYIYYEANFNVYIVFKRDQIEIIDEELNEAQYQGKTVTLNKPKPSDNPKKKYMVYTKNEKGNVVKVYFGDPNMEIRRDNPNRRKAFRNRHSCDDDKPNKWEPRYWACKFWDKEKVSDLV